MTFYEEYILSEESPWRSIEVPSFGVPGMISHEERQYYMYSGQSYAGEGAVVEIGSWLGCSTNYIIEGLRNNGFFKDKKLYVYDDFVWRSSWMKMHCTNFNCPDNHNDFLFLFDNFTKNIAEYLVVRKERLSIYDGNENVPPIKWTGGKIEILYVDCGRTYEVNNAWWEVFHPFFIKGKTLVIMQDWQVYKEKPFKEYNQTKQFTDSKGQSLSLLHELKDGHLATFLYHGDY